MDRKEFSEQLTNLHLKKMLTKDLKEREKIQGKIDTLSNEYKKELASTKLQDIGGKKK